MDEKLQKGQRCHQGQIEICTSFCRTKSHLPLQQEVLDIVDKVISVCQDAER